MTRFEPVAITGRDWTKWDRDDGIGFGYDGQDDWMSVGSSSLSPVTDDDGGGGFCCRFLRIFHLPAT